MDTTFIASIFAAAGLGAALMLVFNKSAGSGFRRAVKYLLTERPVTKWLKRTMLHWADVFHPILDVLDRLFRFWSPRLTDRSFLALIVGNSVAVMGIALTPELQNVVTLALWGLFNMLAEPFPNTPTHDRLPPSRLPQAAPDPVNPHGGPPMVDEVAV